MIFLPDEIANDPGLLRAGVYGKAAFLDVMGYAAQQRTDGFVPSEYAKETKDRATGVAALEASGVLMAVVAGEECLADERAKGQDEVVRAAPYDGYWIASYLRWNITKEEGLKLSKDRSEAGKEGAKARERRAKERAAEEASAQAKAKQLLGRAQALAKQSSPVQSSTSETTPEELAVKGTAAGRTCPGTSNQAPEPGLDLDALVEGVRP